MSKVRVYEYAKNNQVSSKKVIETLKGLGIEVANHMSMINENALRQLDNTFKQSNKPTTSEKKQPTTEAGKSKGQDKPNMTNSKNTGTSKPANKPSTTTPTSTNTSQRPAAKQENKKTSRKQQQ